MAIDLTEIQKRINAIVGQSVSVTEGDTDWTLRSSYINRAQRDWAERYDWRELYTEFNSMTSTGSALASISLPTDFRKLAGMPILAVSNNGQFPEIDPGDRIRFNSTDRYSYVLGDPSGNRTLIYNPATLASGTSIFIPYYKTPASLVSGYQVTPCPNPNYLVQQSLYYYFLANEDSRFQSAKAEAENILAIMLEFENVRGSGYANVVGNVDDKAGFRWGRD